jgi:competence protein ComEC
MLVGSGLVWLFAVLLILSVALIIFINTQNSVALAYRLRYVAGVALMTTILSLAYLLTYFHTDINSPHHLSHMTVSADQRVYYTARVTEPVVVKEKSIQALLYVNKISYHDTTLCTEGKVMASIKRDPASESLQYGDELLFDGSVHAYDAPKNPDQFDFGRYQSLHHIYERVYLRPDQWRLRSSGGGNRMLAQVYQVRSYFLSLIKQEVDSANELAVATAITLGYRDYMNDDVMQAYSGSGVLHVLSVSGLHVAVLFFVLDMLLGWMDNRRKLQITKAVLVIIIMLFYAGLTGLSPPVLRSVWMFSLIVIARVLDREVSMYNVLALSCMVLLIWDPYYIADAGFQLSYISVFGIVYLYPLIFGLIRDTAFVNTRFTWINAAANGCVKWSWGLISVSIAAQLATVPLSLYYFHNFPNFFLLSNMVVIPLSNLILMAGMLLFSVGWCEPLVHMVGWVFSHLLIGLNSFVFWVDHLPFALIKGLCVTVFQMQLMYVSIMMMCWYIADRRAKVLMPTLLCVLILCTDFSLGSIRNENKREMVVYSVPGRKAIAFVMQKSVYFDFDSAMRCDEKLKRNNVREHWWKSGVVNEIPADSMPGKYETNLGKVYALNGKRILVIDKVHLRKVSKKLKVDVAILSDNVKIPIEDIVKEIDVPLLVFDTSNRPVQIKKWKESCGVLHIKYHDCREKAFEMPL